MIYLVISVSGDRSGHIVAAEANCIPRFVCQHLLPPGENLLDFQYRRHLGMPLKSGAVVSVVVQFILENHLKLAPIKASEQ